MPREEIHYSDKYTDDIYEYRHVILPKKLAKLVLLLSLFHNLTCRVFDLTCLFFHSMIPKTHTMSEAEWRGLGVQQSLGWVGSCCYIC